MDEHHFFAAVKHVEQNPVRAKMVKHPLEYLHSSAAHNIRQKEDALITSYPPLEKITDWKSFLNDSMQDIEQIRERTRTGRPYGDTEFYTMIEKISGRNLHPKKAGRPKQISIISPK